MAVVFHFVACPSFLCLILSVISLSVSLPPSLHSFLLIPPTHLYLINFDHTVGEWDGEVGRRNTDFGEENFLNKIK